MNLVLKRNNPFQLFENSLMDFFAPSFFNDGSIEKSNLTLSPSVSVSENDKEVVVTAELPGISKEDVELKIEDNVLEIKGEKKSQKEENKRNYSWNEISYGMFTRHIRLSSKVDAGKAKASYENGVLTLTIPKDEKSLLQRIKIS